VLIVFALPMHPLALMLFLAYMIVRNVVGHLGFEIWPAWFARHPFTRWHLTATHHDLHHRFGKGNSGLYFGFWDDWAGTGRSDYLPTYEAVTTHCVLRARTAAAAGLLCVAGLAGLSGVARAAQASPGGLWTTIDDHTGEVRTVWHHAAIAKPSRATAPLPRCAGSSGREGGAWLRIGPMPRRPGRFLPRSTAFRGEAEVVDALGTTGFSEARTYQKEDGDSVVSFTVALRPEESGLEENSAR
jgi:hypothetical protein